MSILDRWLRRTDDARRMKGDPPPTYAQLVAEIRLTQAAVAKAEEMAVNLRKQCDGLIAENARLRLIVAELGVNAAESKSGGQKLDVEPKPTLREERLGRRFPTLPEYTYEATYGPVPEAGKDETR